MKTQTQKRSQLEYEENILQGLAWLGLKWDAQFRQSDRADIYGAYIDKLLQNNKAFYCWHTKQELQQEQKKQIEQKQAPRHMCEYKNTTPSKEHIDNAIIRFNNTHTQQLVFSDLIKGDISFDPGLLGDFSIAKNTHTALYNFAVVVDDFEMDITDVIRGEDHISNTPKQILLQQALDFPIPRYAHLPLILGTDKSKLSKRHGATAVHEYKEQGYLARAMFNFLCLLGWHPDGDQEIYTQQEIIQQFSLSRVQVSPAIFDIEKLQWMNKRYIQALGAQQFERSVQAYYSDNPDILEQGSNKQALFDALQQRIKTLADIPDTLKDIVEQDPYHTDLLCYKEQSVDKVGIILQNICDIIHNIPQEHWNKDTLSQTMLTVVDNYDTKGQVLHPLRVAMSGKKSSPPPFEIMEIVGKQESMKRIERAIMLCNQ